MSAQDEKGKQRSINKSELYINSAASAAITINTLHSETLDVSTLMHELNESFKRVKDDNLLEVEAMLLSQAQTLNVFFHRCLSQIGNSDFIPHIQTMSDLALRAQNNCRKTLATLAEIKNPKRAMFIKQQNNAINQQVNNNSENLKKPANEVLTNEVQDALDDRSTEETVTAYTTLETLETIDRS